LKKAAKRKPNDSEYISLFSGAMGLDIGLERAGFKCLLANEIDPLAVRTIGANRPAVKVISDSVETVSGKAINDALGRDITGISLLAGGPPCQAFSVFGQRRGVEDSRGGLVFEFIRLVEDIKPKTFLMENVRGLHSMPMIPRGKLTDVLAKSVDPEHLKNGSLLREIVRRFHVLGYRLDIFLVNAVNYGAPQIRERLLVIGNRFGLKAEFPGAAFSNRPQDGLPHFRTLREVIGGKFVDPDPDVMDFSPRKLRYLSMVPEGGNWRNLPIEVQKESMGKSWYLKGGRSAYWRRLSFDFPSPTVVTMPNHAGTSMCHPTLTRALTVGELSAIQEFPPEWHFLGSASDKCRQIGNAVPPRLGEVAGTVIANLLQRIREKEKPIGLVGSGHVTHIRPHVRTRTYFKKGENIKPLQGYYDQTPQRELAFG
jgi:DNA (cytosine-5)-methyltransferase 1